MFRLKEILGWILLFLFIGVLGVLVLAPAAEEEVAGEETAQSAFVTEKNIETDNSEAIPVFSRAIIFQVVFGAIMLIGLLLGHALYKKPGDIKSNDQGIKNIASKVLGAVLLLLGLLYPFLRYQVYNQLEIKPLYLTSPVILFIFPIVAVGLGIFAKKIYELSEN